MKTVEVTIILLLLSLLGCSQGPGEATADYGVVVTGSPEATKAGVEVLKQGGNAVDAAVAVAFALGVTEPAMSGLGGGMQVLLAVSGQEPVAINGTTYSPAATPVNATADDLRYHRRATIPSTVRTLEYLWRRYGSGNLEWAALLTPAIRYAEQGFVMGPFRHKVYRRYGKALMESPYNSHLFLLPGGHIPAVGDTLRQPVLAQTLRRLAEAGADDFYRGDIARSIAADMEKNEGWITLEDLSNFPEPVEHPPLHTTHHGFEVYSQPPPSGGWNTLLILNLLELIPNGELVFPSRVRLRNLIKTLDLGHQDRILDPLPDLKDYQEAVARKIDKEYARQLLESYKEPALIPTEITDEGETTHFSIVDANGTAIAVTASINAYFGALAAAPDLGFLYNTYMDDFELGQPNHPYAIRPGAMAYSSMSPTIVRRDGQTVLVIGSPGSKRIISTVAQLTQMWIQDGGGLKGILNAPRIHVDGNNVFLEDQKIPNEWIQELRQKGYILTFPSYDLVQDGLNAYFGGVHAIAREKDQWVGAADPRRDGKVGRSDDQ